MDIYDFFSINNDWWSRASKLCKSLFLTHLTLIICSVQFSLVTQLCLPLCDRMDHGTTVSITTSRSPPKLMSMELVMPSNHLIPCHPLLFLPSYCSWGSRGKNTEVVCHSLLQWTTFCQNSPPLPVQWVPLHRMTQSFLEFDKAVVLVIRSGSFL